MNPTQSEAAASLLPLALRLARKYSTDDELQSVAQLALCQAVEAFQPQWGISLKTHAYRSVKRALCRYYRGVKRRRESLLPHFNGFTAGGAAASLTDSLSEETCDVVTRYYLHGQTLREIAADLRVPRRRVWYLLERAKECLTDAADRNTTTISRSTTNPIPSH